MATFGQSRPFLWAHTVLVLGFLLIPLVIIIPMSFGSALSLEFPPRSFSLQWYVKYFSSPAWVNATVVSFQVATATTILATVLGTLAAFGLVRGRFAGREALYTFMLSPLIIPAIIVAVASYLLFAKVHLVGTKTAIVLAHTVIALPLVIVNVAASLKGFDENIERAAMSAGADRLQTFRYVTLPIIRPGFVAGAIFAFIASFDEVVIAVFLSGPHSTTLPKRMWDSVLLETDPTISAISTLLIVATVAALACAALLRRE